MKFMDLRESDITRFWNKVDTFSDCWNWQAGKTKKGYGKFTASRRTLAAHRVSFELSYNKIPDGICVLHHCDNPTCVNPKHLFLGTQADNVADRDYKGRQARGKKLSVAISLGQERGDNHWSRRMPERVARGDRNGIRLHPECRAYGKRNGHYTHPERTPRGEAAGNAKLNVEKIKMLRCEYATGNVSQDTLALKYGIAQSVVSHIIRGKNWKHVT